MTVKYNKSFGFLSGTFIGTQKKTIKFKTCVNFLYKQKNWEFMSVGQDDTCCVIFHLFNNAGIIVNN